MTARFLPDGTLDIETARAFVPLTGWARYLGAHGGRGSAKSHFFAEKLVETALTFPDDYGEPLYAVCIREIQKSLTQSAKRVIESKIAELGSNASRQFDVQKDAIITPGGGRIIFQGMQNHTADSIKSLEGYHVAWVEEAQSLSAHSLRILRPTMRKLIRMRDGTVRKAALWFSWNPRFPTDPVDNFFRGNDPANKNWARHPEAIVIEANWPDNPWFEETALVDEMKFDRDRDQDTYNHVWLGGYETKSNARVFRNWRVEWFEPPPAGTMLYGGGDWGFSVDPTVGLICFIKGRTLYVWREVWGVGCEIDRLPQFFDKLDPDWTPERSRDPNWKSLPRRIPLRADSSRPDTISYMKRSGFPLIRPAIKGAGSIEDGVEFLKSYDIVVHPDCKHVEKELTRYSYLIDKKTEEVTAILADKENHTIDSLRYALEDVRHATRSSREELRL